MDRFPALLGAALALASPHAIAADTLTEVRACTNLTADADRLACYDRALARANTPPGDAAAAPPSRAEPAAEFGLSQKTVRERQGLESTESIEATVAAVGRSESNRQVVTLGNGQVWLQSEASTRLRLKAGDAVSIKRAAMGSYLLTKASQGAMRVKRLQ